MPYLETIAGYSPGRKNSYEVTIELKVRKMLEKHTSYLYEFRRTEDMFDTDITAIRYQILPTGWTSEPIGFIEVEETALWNNGIYPTNWRTYSYLARKVFNYDRQLNVFTADPVKNADKTIYLKVARDLSDCHASNVFEIANTHESKWIDNRKGLGNNDYNRLCLRYSMNSSYVKRGINDCMNYILETLKGK